MTATSGETPKRDFVAQVADYIETHPDYESWTKRQAAMEAVGIVLGDIGCAQHLLQVLDVPWDLYERQPPAGFVLVKRGCEHEFDPECARCETLAHFQPWRRADG